MNEKITKKNSILFNKLWINKAIEDGNSFVLLEKTRRLFYWRNN